VPAAERCLLLTCEHGGKRVPRAYRALFRGSEALLASHRGFDPGALSLARSLARALSAELIAATTTRLLVDLNRSPHNPAVFSELSRSLSRDRRQVLLAHHHRPHWERVRAAIAAQSGGVIHLAVHSFAPIWRGVERKYAMGILYDPARRGERHLAASWQRRLRSELPHLRVRRNAPYRGNADGLITALRRRFPAKRYLGLELELNQGVIANASERRAITAALASTLAATLAELG
jgi:predicted N-formylglutamate amidohydrolase